MCHKLYALNIAYSGGPDQHSKHKLLIILNWASYSKSKLIDSSKITNYFFKNINHIIKRASKMSFDLFN